MWGEANIRASDQITPGEKALPLPLIAEVSLQPETFDTVPRTYAERQREKEALLSQFSWNFLR